MTEVKKVRDRKGVYESSETPLPKKVDSDRVRQIVNRQSPKPQVDPARRPKPAEPAAAAALS